VDFPLNSSLILAVTVGLWLLWVAPYIFRLSGTVPVPASRSTVGPAPSSTAIRSSISADGLSQQGNTTMYNESTSNRESAALPGNHAPRTPSAGAPHGTQGSTPVFRVRYGRTALALIGALSLAAVVLGLPLAAFGAASWWLPLGAAGLAAAAVASLRALTVRDRRRRIEAAFRAAMSAGSRQAPVYAPQPEYEADDPQEVFTEPARAQRETVLFDAQSTPGAGSGSAGTGASAKTAVTTAPGAAGHPFTAAELRSAALSFAAASAPQGPPRPPKTSATPWEPIAVPKPIYVEAPVAQRPAPEPLVPPQTPKPAGRPSLRAGGAPAAVPGAGKINLDDVLQRRRA